MFSAMALEGVLGAVQRLENAKKKRSIRVDIKLLIGLSGIFFYLSKKTNCEKKE